MTSFPAFAWLFVQTQSVKNDERSEADVKSFSEKQENANTKNETSCKLKSFKKFLASEEEIRKLKKFLPPSCKNLRQTLCSVLEKKNGELNTPVYIIKGKLHVSSKI